MVWIPVMLLTEPEDEKTLEAFYRRVRPGGPGWSRFRTRLDLQPVTRLSDDLIRTGWAALALVSGMLAVGALVLGEWRTALIASALAAAGIAGLSRSSPKGVAG